MEESSITAIKAAFIRSQVRQLSAPLEFSTQWQDLAPEPEEGRLSGKVIQDVVSKVNEKIKQHNRMVYSQQSQRHVAEQIETLHWNLVSADSERAELDTVVVRKDADLMETPTIESLPETWDDLHLHPDHEEDAGKAETFTALRNELLELSKSRDMLKRRLAQYRHWRKLLEPLDDPQSNVQPNLVTRDGELSKELNRTRVLLARVTGRVSEIGNSSEPRTDTSTSQTKLAQTDQQKLARVMELT
ncbi:uncharacterized protein Z518_03721 [Rhinocladiella mackenziei CBS 650.93]|uniref:Kinetochore protein fta4 n=1 Tax=Rhinocladiella mackenziei CBS 650.93 TaxID=1442369 RepID=A0A0D2IJ34_9EURO|nr:uncharacterized protein Z518_03721 [Rhinocladiella mackenziei CBS 650.93]KIX05749.1 hypothetical protein Z518_03721 [Rhinocladiella mackenziei CBS 650.93]